VAHLVSSHKVAEKFSFVHEYRPRQNPPFRSLDHPVPLNSFFRTFSHKRRLFRPDRDLLRRVPLLDERQELWLTGDVFLQNLGDIETLWGLVVLEDTAECSLRRTHYVIALASPHLISNQR
jgi:hypothetical protein